MLGNSEIFDNICLFFSSSSIGVESILFVSSLYSNPLVRTTILEICCYHCHYIRHFRHSFRLGDKAGTYGYIFTVAFKNVVLKVYTYIYVRIYWMKEAKNSLHILDLKMFTYFRGFAFLHSFMLTIKYSNTVYTLATTSALLCIFVLIIQFVLFLFSAKS